MKCLKQAIKIHTHLMLCTRSCLSIWPSNLIFDFTYFYFSHLQIVSMNVLTSDICSFLFNVIHWSAHIPLSEALSWVTVMYQLLSHPFYIIVFKYTFKTVLESTVHGKVF